MDLNSFYQSLHKPEYRNKYEAASHYFNLDYRIITGRDAFQTELPPQIKQFIMEYGEVLALPNKFEGSIIGFLLRPIDTKSFRYYAESKIPYGAGISEKPYTSPWIIVESCLDSDFLRQYYPYVIATMGVTISRFLLDFLFNTSPYIIAGFDNDTSGNDAFKNLCYKYKGRVKRLLPPLGNKDFGDTLQHLYMQDTQQFDLESMMIQASLSIVKEGLC